MEEPFRPTNVHAAQGAQLKDQDLVKWLEKKLSDMEGWSGRSSASIVSREMVDELMTCFQAVDPQTKLKLMLSYPHINPRNLALWRESLNNLLGIARRDPDDWVEVISELYRDVPNMGMIHPEPSNDNQYYNKTIEDMKELLAQYDKQSGLCMNPRSFEIASTSVQKAVFGASLPGKQHFFLKKNPKSFFLQKDLEKQSELVNIQKREKNQGIISSSVPIKMRSTRREGNNDLPMKGIPTQNTVKLSAGFTNEPKKFQRQLAKRDGGAKLIDICELPQSLKKRRQLAQDEDRRKKIEEKMVSKKKAAEDKRTKEELIPGTAKAAVAKNQDDSRIEREISTPSESVKVNAESLPVKKLAATHKSMKQTEVRQAVEKESHPDGSSDDKTFARLHETQMKPTVTLPHPNSQRIVVPSPSIINRPSNQARLIHPQAMANQSVPPLHKVHLPTSQIPSNIQSFVLPTGQSPEDIIRKHHEATIVNQCQDMLRTANALDDSGREMVMSFMRGNKHNPRPELGNVITLKLSETIEDGVTDGQMRKMKVETFFQMDYGSGEWKRLRKCRLLDQQELSNLLGAAQPSWGLSSQFGQKSYPQY